MTRAVSRRSLQTLFSAGTLCGLTDGQLLERFLRGRGDAEAEAAFTALVERHGPMVLRVCRGDPGRPARRGGRLPGDVPGPGAAGRDDPAGGIRWRAGCMAWPAGSRRGPGGSWRGGASWSGDGWSGSGSAEPVSAAARGALARAVRGARPAARAVPRRGRALRPGGALLRAGRGLAPLPAGDVAEPAGAGPGAAPASSRAPRDRAGRRPDRLGRGHGRIVAAALGRDRRARRSGSAGGDRTIAGADPGAAAALAGAEIRRQVMSRALTILTMLMLTGLDGGHRDRVGGSPGGATTIAKSQQPSRRRRRPMPGRSTSAWSMLEGRGIAGRSRSRSTRGIGRPILRDRCRGPRD